MFDNFINFLLTIIILGYLLLIIIVLEDIYINYMNDYDETGCKTSLLKRILKL